MANSPPARRAFARGLAARGVIRAGDRVAILLPQGFETVIAHVAIYKLGAIALPLALLFGAEALEYRLRDAGAARPSSPMRFGFRGWRRSRDSLETLALIVILADRRSGRDRVLCKRIEESARHARSLRSTAARTIRR